MQILCLGLSHSTAPIELRERLDFPALALKPALARFGCGRDSRSNSITEFAILPTCNRLELYALAPNDTDHQRDLFAALIDFLVETRGVPAVEFEPHLYRHAGSEAVEHLCCVAAGLDSMILGEPQILGQVGDAYDAALTAGAVGPVLSALFRTAIRAGKRARTETAISRNPASVSSVAVRLAEQIVGELAARHVLIVGAGEMGELAVEALRARGVRQVTVVNRTRHRAVELAERWGGEALSFEYLAEAVHAADIVISSTGAPHIIIDSEIARRAMTNRARPLALIDIAMPRDVDPAVGDIPGVHLFDLDHLHTRLDGAIAERQSEVPRVEAIVAEEVSVFDSWLRGVDILPVITDLRVKAERIRQRELARTLHYLPDLDPEARQHIERLSESLVNKLLHEPTRQLRAEAGNGHAAEYTQTVRRLFGLATGSTPATTSIEPD
jgi:glutamyl-tRNA reductase